jgi:hypothetical protein
MCETSPCCWFASRPSKSRRIHKHVGFLILTLPSRCLRASAAQSRGTGPRTNSPSNPPTTKSSRFISHSQQPVARDRTEAPRVTSWSRSSTLLHGASNALAAPPLLLRTSHCVPKPLTYIESVKCSGEREKEEHETTRSTEHLSLSLLIHLSHYQLWPLEISSNTRRPLYTPLLQTSFSTNLSVFCCCCCSATHTVPRTPHHSCLHHSFFHPHLAP